MLCSVYVYPVVSQYVFGGKGSNTCPTGSTQVSEEECLMAARALIPETIGHSAYLFSDDWEDKYAPGCSILTGQGDTHYVYWNTASSGKNNPVVMPVCKYTAPGNIPLLC